MSMSRVPALLLVLLGLALSTACGQIGEEPVDDTSDAEDCDNGVDDDGDGAVDCDDSDCDC